MKVRDLLTRAVGGDLKTWATLTEAGVLTSLGVLPYVLWLFGNSPRDPRRTSSTRKPPAPSILLLGTVAQSQLLFGLVTAAGLRSCRRIGLQPPRVEGGVQAVDARTTSRAAVAGLAGGSVAVALDATVFRKSVQPFLDMGKPPLWQMALASTYGAVGEELLLRLGLQSFVALGLQLSLRSRPAADVDAVMWTAIVLSNVAFGLGHLPATGQVTPITPALILRALLLNGLVGIPAGYLYWKDGLQAAMTCHGAADVVLHLIAPAFVANET